MIGRILLGLLAAMSVAAQATIPRRFDVVSVKPCKAVEGDAGRGRSAGGSASPGRLDLKCRTVTDLVQMAYGHVPVSGGPAWMGSERYDIDAAAEGAPGQAAMRGPMLQALLEDRFQLKVHRESREIPVYALTVAKGGPKLQAAQPGKCIPRDAEHPVPSSQWPPGLLPCGIFAPSPAKDGVYMYSTTLAYFCAQLSVLLDREVVDRTGIAGSFDIYVEKPLAEPSGGDPDGATFRGSGLVARASSTDSLGSAIFNAVQRVGLKLEPAKGTGEFLVIDRVERPSEN